MNFEKNSRLNMYSKWLCVKQLSAYGAVDPARIPETTVDRWGLDDAN